MVLFAVISVKRSILLSIIISALIVTGIGSYFIVTELIVINNKVIFHDLIVSETVKGEPVEITLIIESKTVRKVSVQSIEMGILSDDYGLNDSVSILINSTIQGKGLFNITVLKDPVLNTTLGYFALNVGEFNIYSAKLIFNKIANITKVVDKTFQIINPLSEEQIENGGFEDNLTGWEVEKADNNLTYEISDANPLGTKSFHVLNNELIQPGNSTWVSIGQTLNLTNSHYLSFDLEIMSNNCSIEIKMLINNEIVNMSLHVNENSTQNQLIHYGYATGESDIALRIVFIDTEASTDVFVDNLSAIQYEHRVFVFMLNDNWETIDDEIGRKSLFTTLNETSYYFERELGIKLIPLLELSWYPENTSMSVVDDIGLEAAGVKLNLDGEWDMVKGRSNENHGFDHLVLFSNQTSDHFGFAYYEYNAAFHFAQSLELGIYSWIPIIGDWAENLAQHEISHNFGAHDRDSASDPSSVMSKPSTPDQLGIDLAGNKLWLQVNNWMLEDILLMLKNKAMFD